MPIEPLIPLFHRLNREHFGGLLSKGHEPLLALRWSDGRLRRTAGLYRSGLAVASPFGREIVLSKPLLGPLPREATESTLCHEMIHAWVDIVLGAQESHGPHFRARMSAINKAQNRFKLTVRHRFLVPSASPRWIAFCPKCGFKSPYRRLVNNLACKACCEKHYGGIWHPSCVLRFEPID